MSVEENKEIVRCCIDAFNAQDLETIDELVAPEYQPQVHGQNAWAVRTFPGHHVEITDMVAEGDKVWVRLRTSGAYAGGFLDIPASDVQWTNTGAFFYRLAGGKIIEGEGLWDIVNHARELGAKVIPVS
jgi:predicted ester cyclase